MNKKHLIFQKKYWPSFWTMFFGAFNDNLFKNALIVMVTYKLAQMNGQFMDLDPKSMVALCGGIFILPFFLFSATAGQVSDKYPKNQIIRWVKICEVIIMLIGAVGFFINHLAILMLTLFLMGLQSSFFGPVKYSILPEILDTEELVQGNAYFSMGTFVSILLGTIAGSLIVSIPDSGTSLISLSIVGFAVTGFFFSTKINQLQASSPEIKVNYSILSPSLEILKITKKDKKIFLTVIAISFFWLLGAALLSTFPIYAKDSIGGDEGVVTLFLALFSIGIAVGSLLCERISKKELVLGLVPVGTIGVSVFLMDLFFIGEPAKVLSVIGIDEFFQTFTNIRIAFDIFMLSVFSGFYTVPLYTYLQRFSSEGERSRVIAGLNIINAFFMVGSAFFLIFMYQLNLSIGEIFGILSLVNLVFGVFLCFKMPDFIQSFKMRFL